MQTLSDILTIIRKDLLQEFRSREVVTSMLFFAILVVVIFNFVFDPGTEVIRASAAGILWVAFLFAGTLGLTRSITRELDRGTLQGIMLCPVDRSAIFVAKALGNAIFIFLVELITLPIFIILFNYAISASLIKVITIFFWGTLGFAAVGTLFATISAQTKAREIMLPVLLFPVIIPIVIAAVKSTDAALVNASWANLWPWLRLLIGFDVVFGIICYLMYEFVLEE